MARADLLIRLVEAGIQGNKATFRKVVDAIIAEEQSMNHLVIVKKLERILSNEPNERLTHNGNSTLEHHIDNYFHEITPQRTFADIVLPKSVQVICTEFIQEQHRTDLLRSYNLEPRNRLLLVGPPGNGKTTLAEVIAESLVVPLLIVRYENIIGTFLGETATRLNRLFEYVSKRKCVLFLDEFETLGKERGDSHETGEIKRVVSSLLMLIDDLPSHVVVICATNHPELLDRAVWRRFQIRMNLPYPTRASIIKWLELFERNIDTSFNYSYETLAKKLHGLSFAEVEEFGNSVYRQYVLGMPDSNMRKIVANSLSSWKDRTARITQQKDLEEMDA